MYVELSAVAVLVALLCFAAWRKGTNIIGFADYLERTLAHLGWELREQQTRTLATLIVLLELLLAASLVGPWSREVGAYGTVLFLCGATLYLGLQYGTQGESSCHCFGAGNEHGTVSIRDPEEPADTVRRVLTGVQQAVRNSAIACLAVLVLAQGSASAASSLLLALVALLPMIILALALDFSVLRQQVFLRRQQHPRYDSLAPQLSPLVVLDYYRAR